MTIRSLPPILLLLLLALGTGCSSTITNLTPSRLPRVESGYYPFEMAMETRQQSIRKDSIQPYVVIGFDKYPMQRTPRLPNRWETLVPVAATNHFVTYQFRVDYMYNSMPQPRPSSLRSQMHQLEIVPGDAEAPAP